MFYIILGFTLTISAWIVWELNRAPIMDEDASDIDNQWDDNKNHTEGEI